MLRICVLACAIAGAWGLPSVNRDAYDIVQVYDTESKISEDGFTSETHHVRTSDGYILEMNRIPRGRGQEGGSPKPVVFLMHGLTGSALAYVRVGPEQSMAYNLADAGFDVWIGNARGVLNSRNHIKLDPNDEVDKMTFFDFSIEQIGTLDVPAMIDYILEYTGNEKLNYIGHSQGGTVFLILSSMRPEYNEKFTSVHLLAGVGYMRHFPDATLRAVSLSTDIIYGIMVRRGFVELMGPEWNEINDCDDDDDSGETCQLSFIKDVLIPIVGEQDVYAGISTKQLAHYGQNIRDRSFRRWNYGLLNWFNYGSRSPPVYDLGLITANVTMHYSLNDELLSEADVLDMAAAMPNAKVRKVDRDSFAHNDYMVASDAKELVTDYIIQQIKNKLD